MRSVLIATRNRHKAGEIRAILGEAVRLLTLSDFPGAPKVIEDAETFAGNAIKKAAELARWLADESSVETNRSEDFLVLADDSGLEVDALEGAPGVHSARFAALEKTENSPDAENNAKLLRLLKDVPEALCTARFHCVMALVPVPESVPGNASPVCYAGEEARAELFDGVCEGKVIRLPRGQNGFGYDPLFVPDGYQATFAELGDDVKNRISHRAKALEKLKAHFSKLAI